MSVENFDICGVHKYLRSASGMKPEQAEQMFEGDLRRARELKDHAPKGAGDMRFHTVEEAMRRWMESNMRKN